MKPSDRYHKWIEWSEEDSAYLGNCPDLKVVIHGPDPVRLYTELCEMVDEIICHFEPEGRLLPSPRVRITRSGRPAGVLLSAEEYEGLMETLDILSDPELSRAVQAGLEEADQGRLVSHEEVWNAVDDPVDR